MLYLLHILYWTSIVLLIYVWCGYLLLLLVFRYFDSAPKVGKEISVIPPIVSVIVTVYNEESKVSNRITNILDTDYPINRLDVIIASDGSTDRTHDIVMNYVSTNIRLLKFPRRGKSFAQNEAVKKAKGDIILFTDVATSFVPSTIVELVKGFTIPNVGGCVGQIKWRNVVNGNKVAESGGLYWRFEMILWELESHLGLMAWGSGACLSVKKSLFNQIPEHIGEDSIVPLNIIDQGYKFIYLKDAIAYDDWSSSIKSEFKARVRMTLRSFLGTLSKTNLINPIKNPGYAWSIWSHKILRWMTPYILLIVYISNLFLLSRSSFFMISFGIQTLFYLLGIIGVIFLSKGREIPLFTTIGSFLVALFSFGVATLKLLARKKVISH